MKQWQIALLIAGGLASIALIIRTFSKIKEGAQKVGDTIAAPIAGAIIPIIVGTPVRAIGKIRLPDGSIIDVNTIRIDHEPNTENFSFKFNGRLYRLLPRGTDGIYNSSLT